MASVPPLDDVDAFLADLRAAYVSDPEEAVASRHLAAIAREAELVRPRRTPGTVSWRRTVHRNRFLRPVVTLGAAMLAAILGTAGLAVAGVDLPDPATEAFEQVGITLPNQGGGGQSGEHARSDDVRSVIEATPPSVRGCAFGHSVAEAAKGSALPEQAQDACDKSGGEDGDAAARKNESHGASANDGAGRQFGQDTSDRARGLGGATAEERESFGRDTSERAKQLGGAPDEAPAAEGRPESAPHAGTPAPESTPDGPPEAAPVPDGTPTGPPDGTPGP
jgi:hypothetical protein